MAVAAGRRTTVMVGAPHASPLVVSGSFCLVYLVFSQLCICLCHQYSSDIFKSSKPAKQCATSIGMFFYPQMIYFHLILMLILCVGNVLKVN